MIKKDDTIKKIPFFSKGSLVFKESGHTLVKDKQKYRCSEKAKNKCHRSEERELSAKNLEDKFSDLVEKFHLPEGSAVKLFDHLIELYIRHLRNSGRRDMNLGNLLESTGNLIITDLKEGREYQKSDFLIFKRTYFELIKNFYSDLLIGDAMDFLFTITKSKIEQDDMNSFLKKLLNTEKKQIGHAFSVHVRHVYLSNDGHIESIEFEPFAWFMLNYYKNMVREYAPTVPKGFVLNTKKFEHFDYQKTIEELMDNDLKETYSFNAFATPYAKEKLLKKIFDDFEKLPTQEKIDYLIKLNSPTKEMMFAHFRPVVRE
jgi:hypothetical protein